MIELNEDTETSTVLMSQDEARRAVEQIKSNLDNTRRILLDLYEREGWRALSYPSWRDCAQAEFGQSVGYLYRQLSAAKIERDLDSPIGEIPESHLRAIAKAAPADRPRVIERATEIAGDQPRTAAHIQQAVTESDLPPDYAIVKRRLAAHNIALLSNMQGHHRAFVTRREGMTGVVTFQWADVLSKLERLESDHAAAPAAPTGWACEQCGVIVTDMRKPMNPICSTCIIQHQSDRQAHLVKESRDNGRLERARSFIAAHEHDAARTVLDGIEVSTRERDRLFTQIARDAALAFHNNQRARLKNFSDAAMISQKTFIQALDHIEALLNSVVME